MTFAIGSALLALALLATLSAAIASWVGMRRSGDRWLLLGRRTTHGATVVLGLALALLLAAFLRDDFGVVYVAEHSSRSIPLYLKVSALWAGQEGSLLLWCFLQALVGALATRELAAESAAQREGGRLVTWARAYLSLVTAFFVAITLFLSNPFPSVSPAPADGAGLNPLLRHPGMVFHPVALYLGYVGLAVPAALAFGALASGQVRHWTARARRWTLFAWLFLGLGLLLGARWAYDVLGWGGYWAWDPVENAGLMPWLVATALLHGLILQDQRGRARTWNLILAALSLVFVLFGTFATRSGMIQSVHAFARSTQGPYFLGAMVLVLVSSLWMVYRRRELLAASGPTALLSRDGALALTLALLLTITFSVLIGSLLPTLTDALTGQRLEAGPDWFDRVTGPQFAALVLVMGVCPLLGRVASSLRRKQLSGIIGVAGGLLAAGIAALSGFARATAVAGFFVVGAAGAATLAEYVRDGWVASRRSGTPLPVALWSLTGRNRRRYGGYLVHLSVVLMALGVIGTRGYAVEQDLVLYAGEPTAFQGYTLFYVNAEQQPADDHLTTTASVAVFRGDTVEDAAPVAILLPRVEQYDHAVGTIAVPALHSTLRQDLYLVLGGWHETGNPATFRVALNPLASFLWLGSLLFLVGGTVAAWPAARAAERGPVYARRRVLGTAVVLSVSALVLGSAVLAMWGGGNKITIRMPARPAVGAPAPVLSASTLDGQRLSLADLRGQVVVVNFWASWCPPCEEELPALQSAYARYQEQGLVILGLVYDDQEASVRQAAEQHGLTYPLALDPEGRAARRYGVTGVPETFVIDRAGNVAHVHVGPVTAQQLVDELEKLVSSE